MKKLFILSLLVVNLPAFGLITTNVSNGCDSVGEGLYAVFELTEYNCANGTWLPANSETCISCPANAICSGGTFNLDENNSQGIVLNYPITQNITGGCDLGKEKMLAVFNANEYTCAAGQYLPADGIACVQCPANSYCVGGTYTFNETTAQGITACGSGTRSPAGSSSASQCIPFYTCTSGQYLPKNTTTCTACPSGYTCAGGTYEFDVNNDQGLTANSINLTWQDENGTTVTTNSCTYGTTIILPANPTKPGYKFTGWKIVNN